VSWQEVGDGVYRRCAGHTDNDLVVLVADAGVAFAGDLVEAVRLAPFPAATARVALERTTLTAARLSS